MPVNERRRRKKPVLRAGIWMMLLAASACGADATAERGDAGTVPATPNHAEATACSRDSDCPPDSACSLSAGVCAPLAPGDQAFSVEVLPDAQGGLVGDQFPLVSVSAAGTLHLAVSPPAMVTGRVRRAAAGAGAWTGNGEEAGESPGSPVTGRLVAVADGRIPGTQFWSEATVAGGDSDASSLGTYRLALVSGLAYRVTFVPEKTGASALPSHSFDLAVTGDTSLDIVLPPEDAYLPISGLVRAGTAPPVPLRNATVSCIVDGNPVGTTATTGPDGMFALSVPPGTGPVDFRVAPGPGRDPFPERVFQWQEGLPRLQEDYASSGGLLILDLGNLPAVRTVSLQVLGGATDGQPVSGARVRATGSAGGGTVTQSSVTGGDGLVTLALPEGRYRIGIFPPQGSAFASTYRDMDLTSDGGVAFLVVLEPRPILRGVVLRASDGSALPGSVLTLWTREDPDLADAASPRESTVTVTADGQGAFEVPLDPGRWAASLVPPARSGLPRIAWPTLDFTDTTDLRIQVPEGMLLRGSVRQSGSQDPLAGATVRVMVPLTQAQSDATWSLGQTSFAVTLTTLAEVRTREDGTWDAIVPVRDGDQREGGANPPETGMGSDGATGVDSFGVPLPESF